MFGNPKKSSKSSPRFGSGSGSGSGSRSRGSKSSRSKSTKDESGKGEGWTEWEWDDEYECEWRSRPKANGELEYDYRYPAEPLEGGDEEGGESTPRSSTIDKIIEEQPGETEYSTGSLYNLSNSPQKSGQLSASKGSKSSRSKSTKDESGKGEGWTKWEWDDEYECEWRSRPKANGELEYDYRYPAEPLEGGDEEGGKGTPLSSTIDKIIEEQPGKPEYSTRSLYNLSNSPRKSGQLSTSQLSSDTHTANDGTGTGYRIDPTSRQLSSLTRGFEGLQVAPDPQHSGVGGVNYAQRGSMVNEAGNPTRSQDYQEQENYDEEDDYEEVNSRGYSASASKLYSYQMAPRTAPSYPSSATPTGFGPAEHTAQMSFNTGDGSANTRLPYEQAPTADSNSHIGPAQTQMDVAQETLLGDFRVHHGKNFTFGRVFKICWTEPKGQGMPIQPKGTEHEVIRTKFGEEGYTSIRRFIIFRHLEGHCLCLPILTYKRQATRKGGVKPQDHAIIYTRIGKKGEKGEKPKEADGEEKLLKKAIRMEPKTPRDQLDALSRLNYAKIYTVEYNVKVQFIGQIHEKSIPYFNRDFNLTHQPLPEDVIDDYNSDDDQGFEEYNDRESDPQPRHEKRESEPRGRRGGKKK